MKKIIVFLFAFLILNVNAYASYVVLNQEDNKVIEGYHIHDKRLIASITKVMTAHIVISNMNLNKLVTVGDEINDAHGSSVYLEKGETISIRDLLYGMMLRSGNDAAIVLAKNVGGSVENFVKLMNDEVKQLGLKDTFFSNPTGLDDSDDGNISSAYDMAIITNRAMKNDVFRTIFKTKRYRCKTNKKSYDWYNKNKTLTMYKYTNGGKTGYTKKAKRTLITTASKDNTNLTIVTLNMTDDFNFHINKYKNIYSEYSRYLIVNKYDLNINDKEYKKKNCTFKVNNNYYILEKKNNLKNIHVDYIINSNVKPKSNSIVGRLIVYNKKKAIYEEPIYLICNFQGKSI